MALNSWRPLVHECSHSVPTGSGRARRCRQRILQEKSLKRDRGVPGMQAHAGIRTHFWLSSTSCGEDTDSRALGRAPYRRRGKRERRGR
jgi:hypothetical protein